MNDMSGRTALQRVPIRFVGSGSEYFRIWITNLLLTLLTVGLYYPFAKVRRLRYFYGCTEAGGHALAFHGEPWKMFRGFVLAAALVGAYGVAQRVSPLAAFVAFVVLTVLWPALWHASLRFRLANTGWRGLRMAFTGTRGGAYAALLPALLAMAAIVAAGALVAPGSAEALAAVPVLVFPALVPWLLWRMKRYQHNHYALGGERTRMALAVRSLYGVFARALGLVLLVAIALGAVAAAGGAFIGFGGRGGPPTPRAVAWFTAAIFVSYAIALLVVHPYLSSRLQNLYWNATRSQHLQFESRLRWRDLALLTLRNWLLMIVTLGLYYPFALVATTRLRLEAVAVVASIDLDTLFSAAPPRDVAAAGDAALDAIGLDIGL